MPQGRRRYGPTKSERRAHTKQLMEELYKEMPELRPAPKLDPKDFDKHLAMRQKNVQFRAGFLQPTAVAMPEPPKKRRKIPRGPVRFRKN